MNEPSIFFSEVNERQGVFTRRAFLMGGVAGLGLGVLAGRMAQLQLIQSSQYRKAADENQYDTRLIVPPRGLILDRNNVAIASNRPSFRVLIDRDQVEDLDKTLDDLAQLVPITDLRRRQIKTEPSPVSVAEDLTWEQFSAVNIRAPELPGVTAEMGEVRVYPYGGAFAHVIGYVSRINETEKTAARKTNAADMRLLNHPGFRIGKTGVEKALDRDLRGLAGGQRVEVDHRGRVVRQDPDQLIEPRPGKEVVLSLDADIQNRALEVFGEESGAAVLMDVRTGDVLCMASAPSFDVNKFVRFVPSAEYRALLAYERNPLYDKAISGTYPPGSTFKTMTALAALDSGMIDPERRIVCTGGWAFGGRVWRCHKTHGSQNMHDAIRNSCDIYFYQTALAIGPDRIARTAKAFGLGQVFDIGIPGQRAGIVGSTEWKRANRPREPKWQPGDSVSYGIGQGYINVNALQLAVMTARLANGRKALNPRLIKSIGGQELPRGSDAPDLPFAKEHIDYVRAGMAAVTEAGGTAFRASQLGLGDVLMAGKTGTAQVRSFDNVRSRSNVGLAWKLRDHGLFVAFAPYDDPRYALSVIVQHGAGGSTAAAPRAREIMRVALLKDPDILKRVEKPMPLPEMPVSPEDADEGAFLPPTAAPAPVGAPQ